MSYTEYLDMFEPAQEKGQYFIVIFDGKGHKRHLKFAEYQQGEKLYKESQISKSQLQELGIQHAKAMQEYQNNMSQIMVNIKNQILQMEQEQGRRILHRNEEVYLADRAYQWYEADKLVKTGLIRNIGRINPNFCMADNLWFILEKDTLTEQQIKQMLAKELAKADLPYEFWCDSGYYETDKREEANEKLFREYALQMLEDRAKKKPHNVVSAKSYQAQREL